MTPRERSIIYRDWEMRALLDGRKTRTTVPVKFIPALGKPEDWCHAIGRDFFAETVGDYRQHCPLGVPGDRLVCKEEWRAYCWDCYARDGSETEEWLVKYRADGAVCSAADQLAAPEVHNSSTEWRLPQHMPRWASRRTEVITSVAVGLVQDATTADAIAEGFSNDGGGEFAIDGMSVAQVRRMDFWDKRWPKYPWASNPPVWTARHEVVKVKA